MYSARRLRHRGDRDPVDSEHNAAFQILDFNQAHASNA